MYVYSWYYHIIAIVNHGRTWNMKNHSQKREPNQRERQKTVNTEELSGYGYLCWKNGHRVYKRLAIQRNISVLFTFQTYSLFSMSETGLAFSGGGIRSAFCSGVLRSSYNATARLTTWAACQGAVTQAQPTWIGNIGMAKRTIQNGIRNSSTTWEKMHGWCVTGRNLSEESLIPWLFSL